MIRAKATGVALAVAAGAVGIVGVTAGSASAGTCGQTYNVSVSGGQASWSLSCSGGNIRVAGWVKDTKADGKCAQVKAVYSSGTQWSARACPSDSNNANHIKYYDFNGPGSSVPVYLFTV